MLPVTGAVWEHHAARIRAVYKLQVLDSIHLATAIEHGCGLFLTNDLQLANFESIKVEVLIWVYFRFRGFAQQRQHNYLLANFLLIDSVF